jgi:hypothetical protein
MLDGSFGEMTNTAGSKERRQQKDGCIQKCPFRFLQNMNVKFVVNVAMEELSEGASYMPILLDGLKMQKTKFLQYYATVAIGL